MTQPTQQEYLNAIKEELDMAWDEVAVVLDVTPRALKAYRLPSDSKGFRGIDRFVFAHMQNQLVEYRKTHKSKRPKKKA